VDKRSLGFVALKSLKQGPPDPGMALSEIRRIYFHTTRQTIDNDLAHAIELLKSLPTEELREKATVFMQGLSEMQREWQRAKTKTKTKTQTNSGKSGSAKTKTNSGKSGRTGKLEP
jgi:hypothetical protein